MWIATAGDRVIVLSKICAQAPGTAFCRPGNKVVVFSGGKCVPQIRLGGGTCGAGWGGKPLLSRLTLLHLP
jgi:hypothetical protein